MATVLSNLDKPRLDRIVLIKSESVKVELIENDYTKLTNFASFSPSSRWTNA